LIQCELGEIDFSKIKRSNLKKAGPDLCFQPLFRLVELDEAYELEKNNLSDQNQTKGVRFATMPENDFTVHEPINFERTQEWPLTSGIVFLPGLSKKGTIAVKKPNLSSAELAEGGVLNHFLLYKSH